ncbi:hypothetical protein HHI36_013900 [Cryptolaemus montrouzieri]|uniref:lysozyme n=1 Tax=Cryptolaemus montrouzieri TaxID=559131 RepID=A0ABD2N0U6_9CUCU
MKLFLIQLCALGSFLVFYSNCEEMMKLVNLDEHCFQCLCHAASGCNLTFGCGEGYCGPFRISRVYWRDGANVTLPGDEPERNGGL